MKKYTEEFRESSAKLAVDSKQPISQIAKELGVPKVTLYDWIRRYCSQKSVSKLSGTQDMQTEIKRLNKELSRAKEERDILKKAAAYFANEAK